MRASHASTAATEAACRSVSFERRSTKRRAVFLACASGAVVTLAAVVLLPIGVLTMFRARRLYARVARLTSLMILRFYGIHLRVHGHMPYPASQTVYVSNHTSTLDLFVLVALGLPNCRFFLSGFLRKFVPLGVISWMMGTFFTVPQNRPEVRRQIFQRAERELRRTRESVYLSPEGGRITAGEIGHFNKGAFHLATNLRAPIVPLFIEIPPSVDPGRGFDARRGVVHVHVLPTVDTEGWLVSDLEKNTQRVRDLFVRANRERRERPRADQRRLA